MKAIRKSDGRVIDVDVYDEQVSWVSQVKTTYVDIDKTELYQESDLDFLPEKEIEEKNAIIMNKTKSQQAQEYVLNRQTARHNAKTEEEATMADFDKTRKVWDAYDMEQAFKDGYTACEQSDIRISVAKLREVLEKLVADGDIEPIHVSVDEIINRVKEEK